MTNLLMLGSSHSACFKGAKLPAGMNLAICANMYDNLFSNLLIAGDGLICLNPNPITPEWDEQIFNFSLANASRALLDYDYVVLNIAWDMDLPLLIHGDVNASEAQDRILYSSDALLLDVIHSSFEHLAGTTKNLTLIKMLASVGFAPNKILCLLTPFSSIPEAHEERKNPISVSEKIAWMLQETSQFALNSYGVTIVTPEHTILNNGCFVGGAFCVPDNTTVWRSAMGDRMGPADRKHKNSSYAQHMISRIESVIGER